MSMIKDKGRTYDPVKISEYIRKHDGITVYDGKITTYDTGYQVSTEEGIDFYDLNACIMSASILDAKSWGVWFDSRRGLYVLDLMTLHIEDESEALSVARQYKQKAVFEWSTKKDLYIKYHQGMTEKELF